ncbi:hypothetical protein NQZ68_000949, partial [Dissostichus eleginoides]
MSKQWRQQGGGRWGHGHPDIFVGPPTGHPTTHTASPVTPSLSQCYHGNTLILVRTTLRFTGTDSSRLQQN